MALKHLSVNEMVGLTLSWVGGGRHGLEAIPELAAWLPRLDEVHRRLLKAQPADTSELDRQLDRLARREAALDVRHDRLARTIVHQLRATQLFHESEDPPRPELAQACERASEVLLPGGLRQINKTHIAEHGNTVVARHRLASEPWLVERLEAIPMPGGGTLRDVVEAWCEAGSQLGGISAERSSLQASQDRAPRSELLAARNEWLALVSTMLRMMDQIGGHEQELEALRGPLRRVAEAAGKRAAGRAARRGQEGSSGQSRSLK